MAFKPDYGVKLLEEGVSKEAEIHFYEFRFYSITILGNDQFSTAVEMPYADEVYAVSIDFTRLQLDELIKIASRASKKQINDALLNDILLYGTIDIPEPFSVDITVSLGALQKSQFETFVPLILKSINLPDDSKESIKETKVSDYIYSKEEVSNVLNTLNQDVDIDWLFSQIEIVNNKEKEETNLYSECIAILNLICILEIKRISINVYEEMESDLTESTDFCLELINELEIDFKLFILLAGEEFFKSEYYEYDGEIGESQVLEYLISEYYNNVCRRLRLHYKEWQIMLEEFIKNEYLYDTYLDAIKSSSTLEDCYDHVEIMKLYSWASSGFDMSGEG